MVAVLFFIMLIVVLNYGRYNDINKIHHQMVLGGATLFCIALFLLGGYAIFEYLSNFEQNRIDRIISSDLLVTLGVVGLWLTSKVKRTLTQ